MASSRLACLMAIDGPGQAVADIDLVASGASKGLRKAIDRAELDRDRGERADFAGPGG